MNTRYTRTEAAALPLLWRGDVLIAGGGSAGCAAAVAAARSGADVLLVEPAGFLGGTGAAVLDTFYGFYAPGGGRVVAGVGWELCERLLEDGQAFERPNTYGAGTGVTYEPEALKRAWDELVLGAGARVLHHARIVAVVLDGERVRGAVVDTAAGPGVVLARNTIDATGDAEVAWRAGAAVDRPAEQNRVQPLTATFRMGGVDLGATPVAELHRLMAAASGDYRLPRLDGSVHRTVLPGVVHTNLTRVSGVDATDPWQLSAAEREGRRQVAEYVRFLTERVPGYENAYLLGVSVRIGVRETRRLRGRYVLTREDVLGAREFPDAIARCGAPIEDHDGGNGTIWVYVGGGPSGRSYGVPLRCLVPERTGHLLVAGRCLSATHDAHASVRSMAQCMAAGQAAGTAAALATGDVADTDPAALRAALALHGALL
ncbi:hypothetical protein GCM10017786_06350 [Amycolatopsis deserti]|uniref:FAD-dependent oxidoreductase n=1 Tax=Amycolatopsis deserti TaxID=185696 RepID=A0ABQ3ICP6_9PSEU|nr:FAD-dependent oxidoreductase [Amycolatopsis deserti]GHE79258.1 hypothetical protein GCM10017786_06350 [Amycolatopsis deserti]